MALKLFFAAVIVCGCSYIGIVLSRRYRKREQVFSDTAVFIDGCKSRIGFQQLPLKDILREAAEGYTSELAPMLAQFYDLLANSEFVNYDLLSERIKCSCLTKEEVKLYVQFFDSLGKSDVASQLNSLEEFKSAFSKKHDAAADEKRRFGSMYTKLGVLTGLGLAVLVF